MHVEDGIKQNWFEKPQHKNRNNDAKSIRVPILPVLQDVIDASPIGDLTYLVSERGAPFSASRMGTAIKGWCREAGLPHCSAHGFRKAGATIAAENGASAFQLMSIFGWEDAQQAVGYTRKMERQKMAAEATAFTRSKGTRVKRKCPTRLPVLKMWDTFESKNIAISMMRREWRN